MSINKDTINMKNTKQKVPGTVFIGTTGKHRFFPITYMVNEIERQRADLVEAYKIMHRLQELPSDLLLKTNLGRTRRPHM